jgi:hypothetical protein
MTGRSGKCRGGGALKHERIVGVVDQVPTTFIRTLAICLMTGAAFWIALLWLVV